MSSFPRPHKLRSKRHLLRDQTRRFTATPVRIMPSLGIMGRITTLRLQHSPTSGHTPFLTASCDDCRTLRRCGRLVAFGFRQDGIFAGLKREVGNELSKQDECCLRSLIKAAVRKEIRDDKKPRDKSGSV